MHGIPCPCPECGRPRQASRPDILCPRCHGLRLKKLRAPTVPCTVCGSPTRVWSRNAQQTFRETGRAYCSDLCKKTFCRTVSSRTMARTNRQYAAQRMTAHNPMHSDVARGRMAHALRQMGHCPRTQGGNGRPLPEPQRLLAQALDWPTEVVVKTQMPRGLGYPTHYKIDIAHTTLQIAIEVDGGSHRSLLGLQRDAKKTAFLHGVGWTVLKFSNREVMEHLADCVQTVRSII